MNNNNYNNQDILNAISVILALQNLQENREQSKQNDVQAANDKQAQYLLEKIHQEFAYQNEMLTNIYRVLSDLYEATRGGNYE